MTARILTAAAASAHNTADAPETVAPAVFDGVVVEGGCLHVTLPAASFVAVTLDLDVLPG